MDATFRGSSTAPEAVRRSRSHAARLGLVGDEPHTATVVDFDLELGPSGGARRRSSSAADRVEEAYAAAIAFEREQGELILFYLPLYLVRILLMI